MSKLENLFQQSADIKGPCPLPDPRTDGVRAIEHIKLIRVEKQPTEFNYDQADNDAEERAFRKRVLAMLQSGEIKREEVLKLLG